MIRGEAAADDCGTPSNVRLGVLNHLFFQLEVLGPFAGGWQLLSAPSIPLCGAAGRLVRHLFFMPGWPDPRFTHLMCAVHPVLVTPMALWLLFALASLATLISFATLAQHPIEFPLAAFTPSSGVPMVPILAFFHLVAFLTEGVMRVWLWRCLSLFALFSIKWGGLSFGQYLVVVLLVLAVSVTYAHEGQLHQGHQLHRDMAGHPCFPRLVQQVTQVWQLVKVWPFLLSEARWLPWWCRGGTLLGGLPLHHPFC